MFRPTSGPGLSLLLASAAGCASADSAPAAQEAFGGLEPCASEFGDAAECGWLTVPENRAEPSQRQIDVRIVVLPAHSQRSAEPLLMFPGGPGQATTDLIGLADLYASVRDTRDIVFVGQRGTGASNVMNCSDDIEQNPSLAFGKIFDPDRIARCYQETLEHAQPAHYTTQEYVSDIEATLDVLGYDRALLWGGSGGTRTALAFMRTHPDRTAAAVLDGVAPIDYAMPGPFAKFAQGAWDRVVADCTDQADCRAAFPTLAEDFSGIVQSLRENPAEVSISKRDGSTVDVTFGVGDFAYAVRGILYNAGQTAQLPAEVAHAARTGDLTAFAQALYERSVAIRSDVLAVGLHLSIYCSEDLPMLDVATATEESEGTFLGTYLIEQYSGACRSWPVSAKASDWYAAVESDAPVLLLSGHYDPATPPAAAESVAPGLTQARHLVVRNVGHGAGFNCARPTVERFLANGGFDGFENPCPEEPIQFETGGR